MSVFLLPPVSYQTQQKLKKQMMHKKTSKIVSGKKVVTTSDESVILSETFASFRSGRSSHAEPLTSSPMSTNRCFNYLHTTEMNEIIEFSSKWNRAKAAKHEKQADEHVNRACVLPDGTRFTKMSKSSDTKSLEPVPTDVDSIFSTRAQTRYSTSTVSTDISLALHSSSARSKFKRGLATRWWTRKQDETTEIKQP